MTEQRVCEGGCLCGALRYSFSGDPLITAVCHCRNCQRQSGSAFSIVCVVPAAAYHQTGASKVFADKGNSGKAVFRHFCADCGSPIVSIVEAMPGLVIIKAGTLDRPDQYEPTQEAYCDSRFAWLPPLAGTQKSSSPKV